MPEKKQSKLLAGEPDWPDERDKHRRIGIPAVRAAVMAKTGRLQGGAAAARDRPQDRRAKSEDRR
jgi:hypothetical protein